jgi:hypothetical protein
MLGCQFDPFGELLQNAHVESYDERFASRIIRRVGTAVFWGLVSAILIARVASFGSDFGNGSSVSVAIWLNVFLAS